MKKSNLLLGAALIFFLGCLTAFDFALKAEYETGNYKDRYRGYETQKLADFEEIEINGATQVRYKIMPGTHKVRMHKNDKESLQVRQVGNKLIIDLNLKDKNVSNHGDILIYCPKVKSVTTSSTHILQGKRQDLIWHLYQYKAVTVQGFTLDSLTLLPDHATAIILDSSTVNHLAVKAGATANSNSKITIYPNNHIQQARFDMQHKSQLELQNVQIPILAFNFSPHAQAVFTGSALQLLHQK